MVAPIARLERPPLALTAALNPLPTHVLSDKHKTLILHGTVASSPLASRAAADRFRFRGLVTCVTCVGLLPLYGVYAEGWC